MQLPREDLIEAYTKMKTIREFEERAKTEFEGGNIPGFVHLYVGQEASAVGVCMNLTDSDFIGSTHRGHGHSIAKGCDVGDMMKEIFGRKDGLCHGKGGSMHIADFEKGMLGANGIVGANPPLVTGAALSAKTLQTGGVAVSFCGDGASNQGTAFEAMNMAVVLKLPVIFIFENNGYGEGTGVDYAVGSKDIGGRAQAFGIPTVKVDGTDFFAVHDAARAAIDAARNGAGPQALEVQCKRFHGHFVGDPQSYRSETELNEARAGDPLPKFREAVTEAALLEPDQLDEIDSDVMDLIEASVKAASEAEFPGAADLETDVYISY